MDKVSKVEVGENLRISIEKAVDELGGFGKYIKKGDVVLIKPNYNTADAPPASTDSKFLRVVVDLVYKQGAKSVIVGESSTYYLNTKVVLDDCGVFGLCDLKDPAKIYVFEDREWVKKKILKGNHLKKVTVPKVLDEVDKIILLPCLKTHFIAKFTGALKIAVGFMRPKERIKLHLGRVQEKIADLNLVYKPDLIIMDGRKCFITKGPEKGEVREPNLILASESRVAIDIEGIKIIQGFKGNSLSNIDPENLPQIKRAIKLGIN